MNDLEARRRALAAEADIYRHTLTLELNNVRLYAEQMRQRVSPFTLLRKYRPLLALLPPILGFLLKRKIQTRKARRRRGWMRVIPVSAMGMQAFKYAWPFVRQYLNRRADQRR